MHYNHCVLSPATRARILKSRLLPILVFPYRIRLITVFSFRSLVHGFRWLFLSKEFANFTYDLKPANKEYLAWFVANVCQAPVAEIKSYLDELETNLELKIFINNQLRLHRRGNEIDREAYFGRRIGWYAIVRAMQPSLIVETGTEKGLGSLVLAEAILKNGKGKLITIDMEPSSGLLIGGKHSGVISQVIGDSIQALSQIDQVDMFIHDSDHSSEHEAREFRVIAPRLTDSGIVLSDNSHVTNELSKWSLDNGRKFFYFAEEPLNHWYPGAGIGISVKS